MLRQHPGGVQVGQVFQKVSKYPGSKEDPIVQKEYCVLMLNSISISWVVGSIEHEQHKVKKQKVVLNASVRFNKGDKGLDVSEVPELKLFEFFMIL